MSENLNNSTKKKKKKTKTKWPNQCTLYCPQTVQMKWWTCRTNPLTWPRQWGACLTAITSCVLLPVCMASAYCCPTTPHTAAATPSTLGPTARRSGPFLAVNGFFFPVRQLRKIFRWISGNNQFWKLPYMFLYDELALMHLKYQFIN